ncbi:MAG: POTRA domain-containing protein, partial [Cyanobacteria bacterium P01_D01_bin.1]
MLAVFLASGIAATQSTSAQTPLPPPQDILPAQPLPLPEPVPQEPLPPADELLEPLPDEPDLGESDQPTLIEGGAEFSISRFAFRNSTVFAEDALQAVTADFVGPDKTFLDVSGARAAVTQLYIDAGYVTSGAIVPPQQIVDGVVTIEIVEGSVPDIEVVGSERLNSRYISRRVALGAKAPLNVNRLVERLQLLQSDPLVENITADLQA